MKKEKENCQNEITNLTVFTVMLDEICYCYYEQGFSLSCFQKKFIILVSYFDKSETCYIITANFI